MQPDRQQQLEARVAEAKAEAERAPKSALPYLTLAHAYEELATLDADFSKRAPLPTPLTRVVSIRSFPPRDRRFSNGCDTG